MKQMKRFQMIKRYVLLTLLTLLMCSGPAYLVSAASVSVKNIQTAEDGTFVKKNGKWMYRYEDGTYAKKCLLKIDGKTYYFSSSGYRKYGFQTIGKAKYYFGTSSEGYMYKSKLLKTSKGNYYYLESNGKCAVGWKTIKGKQYYFQKNGKAYTGRHKISGTYYTFSSKGVLVSSGAKLSVSSGSAILINANTGKVLFEKSADTKRANASTTKIMTCILALENCDLDDTVTASANAAAQEPTKLYMKAGESFSVKDLLYSLMLPSHNDTAVALAEHISGTTEKFAKLMNSKAKEIGCTSTNFVTPNGLDNDGVNSYNHYTTARDLALITQYAMKNETFCKIVSTSSYSFKSKQGTAYQVSTTNALLGTMSGVIGVKTGYTSKAGSCFVGAVKAKNGNTYICVVLGGSSSSARWKDAQTLLNYAYKLKK